MVDKFCTLATAAYSQSFAVSEERVRESDVRKRWRERGREGRVGRRRVRMYVVRLNVARGFARASFISRCLLSTFRKDRVIIMYRCGYRDVYSYYQKKAYVTSASCLVLDFILHIIFLYPFIMMNFNHGICISVVFQIAQTVRIYM